MRRISLEIITLSRLIISVAPDPFTAKRKSFEARVKCVRKNPGGNLCDKGSPFHTEGPITDNARARVVDVREKEQRVTAVPMSEVNCDLWCPGRDSKDLGDRPEQDLGYTSRPGHQYGICMIRCWRGSQWSTSST